MIVVDGEHAQRVEDPAVPTRAEVALAMPAPRPWPAPLVRGHGAARPRHKPARRRAVYAALRKELRRKHITASQYRRWRATYVRSVRTLRRLRGARATQLRYVLTSVESLALRRRLGATPHAGRVPPARAQPPVLAAGCPTPRRATR